MKSEHVELVKMDPQSKQYVSYPGIALTEPDADGRLQIMFLHPERHKHLGGADWRDAVDRAVDVLPEGKQAEGVAYYRTLSDGLPSADDLDADASEKETKEATNGKGRKPKPVAVGK